MLGSMFVFLPGTVCESKMFDQKGAGVLTCTMDMFCYVV